MVSIIDGSNPKQSNHLRYINCACNESEQNLVAYQYKGNIFYRTARIIEIGEELLVWYGKEYAKNLGIVDSSMSLGIVVAYLPMYVCCVLCAPMQYNYLCIYVHVYIQYCVYTPTYPGTYICSMYVFSIFEAVCCICICTCYRVYAQFTLLGSTFKVTLIRGTC